MQKRTRSILDALDALANGRLTTEEVIQAAYRRSKAFREWLRAAVEQRAKHERRLPQLRKPQRIPDAILREVLRRAKRSFLRDTNVVNVSWGVKYAGGVPRGAYALIVWVREKLQPPRLGKKKLPPDFSTTIDGRLYNFAVDVQRMPHAIKQTTAEIQPGDRARIDVQGSGKGTLSAARSDGMALFSGHVAGAKGNPVALILADGSQIQLGQVLEHQDDGTVDAAMAGPIPEDRVLLAVRPTSRVRNLGPADHFIGVSVATPDGDRSTFIDAIGAPASFGSSQMLELIRLSGLVSDDGDSGSPVFDSAGSVIGFVVGRSSSHTFVIPAGRVLDAFV